MNGITYGFGNMATSEGGESRRVGERGVAADGGTVQGKVLEYETFLNERLKVDLKAVLDSRDAIYSDIAEYLQLRNVIEKLMDGGVPHTGLKTMVDMGCNFYAQARVLDASHVFVAVGFGFFLEFTLSEALEFIDKKVAHLSGRAEELTEQESQIKARIRVVVEALGEMQFANLPQPQPHRPVW